MPRGFPVLLAGLLAAGGAGAAEHVEFADGRVLEVEEVRTEGDLVMLELEEGGALAIPASLIADRRPYVRPIDRPEIVEPESWRRRAGEYADLIGAAAERHGLEPDLLSAVAEVESGFDPYAVSPKGACGLLQLMPATAERFGVAEVFDAEENLDGGARYLRWLLERYDGDLELALAAYNAGEGAVDRYRGVPPYVETRDYVASVLAGRSR